MDEIQRLCECTTSNAEGDCVGCGFGMDDTADAETNEKVIRLIVLQLRKHARILYDESRKLPRECEGVWVVSYDSLYEAMHSVSLGFVPVQALLLHEHTDEVRQRLRDYHREHEIVVWIRLFEYRHIAKQVKRPTTTTETLHEDEDMRVTIGEDDDDDENDDTAPISDAPKASREEDELDEDLDALEAVQRECYERVMVFNVATLREVAAGKTRKHASDTDNDFLRHPVFSTS
jgi:hypothetical protein